MSNICTAELNSLESIAHLKEGPGPIVRDDEGILAARTELEDCEQRH